MQLNCTVTALLVAAEFYRDIDVSLSITLLSQYSLLLIVTVQFAAVIGIDIGATVNFAAVVGIDAAVTVAAVIIDIAVTVP